MLEEVYHFKQNKSGLNSEKPETERYLLNEIDAKIYLIAVDKKYRIPRSEQEETETQLKSYRKALAKYYRGLL